MSVFTGSVHKLKGQTFCSFDPAMLGELEDNETLGYAEIMAFLQWLRTKRKRQEAWLSDLKSFRPKIRNGRFVQAIFTSDVEIISSGLALLKQFLRFASEKCTWLSTVEAQKILMEYWRLALPESAPTDAGDRKAAGGRWDDPAVFWTFLGEYVHLNREKVAGAVPCLSDTVGVLHQLPGENFYLSVPRTLFLTAYCKWLEQQGAQVPDRVGRWETKVQRTLMDRGILVKTEGEDITWRFRFYQPGQAPAGEKEKLPCLALPVAALPSEIQAVLFDYQNRKKEVGA